MTEWTSISVTEEQKQVLEQEKPEGMAMGAFVVQAATDTSHGGTCNAEPVDYAEVENRVEKALERVMR
jgi:hypothetical protein